MLFYLPPRLQIKQDQYEFIFSDVNDCVRQSYLLKIFSFVEQRIYLFLINK